MFVKKIRVVSAVVSLFASAVVVATPLSEYNIILSGDFNVSGNSGHVEGRTFIGGDLVNGSVFAQYVDKSTRIDTVEVVGDVVGNSQMHIDAGFVAYGGSTNVDSSWNGICNGAGISSYDACFRQVPQGDLEGKKADLFSSLAADSAYYGSLHSTVGTSITGDINNSTFRYAGASTELAVFNVTADELKNVNWNLDMGAASNILINVSGGVFDAGWAHVNGFQSYSDNVLWNFTDATELHFGDSWYGSVLALSADIYTNSNLNGAIAARSYFGNGEIHDYSWSYTPRVSVSESSTAALLIIGFGCLIGNAAFRRKYYHS